MKSKKILFLCHRIPYPPNKGDKIRSYNILRYLSKKNEIFLGCLIDDSKDLLNLESLRPMVKDIFYDVITPLKKKLSSCMAILKRKPISIPYFYSNSLQNDVDSLVASQSLDAVFCFSSPMAEYIFQSRVYKNQFRKHHAPCAMRHAPVFIMDLIDMDSQKWRQYAGQGKFPMRWVYEREAKYLFSYESRIAREFKRILLVSESEKELFTDFIHASNVTAMSNGVDLDYFYPSYVSKISLKKPAFVFTGAMDYRPNIDSVTWFGNKIFPLIRDKYPNANFYIVGSNPVTEVRRLEDIAGAHVTGFVDDVRDYIVQADICVAPLKVARGIQNKVLEAMSMSKVVICTSQALEGINAAPDSEVIVADSEHDFASSIVKLLNAPDLLDEIGTAARKRIEKSYSWDQNLAVLDSIFDN